jgi:hypothetical protein
MKQELDPAGQDASAAAIRDAFRHRGVPIRDAEVASLARALHRLQPTAEDSSESAASSAFNGAQSAADFAAALRQHA